MLAFSIIVLLFFFFLFIDVIDAIPAEAGKQVMSPSPLPGSSGPPPKSPASIGQLTRLVLTYVRRVGLAEKRTRDWISYMAIAGTLELTGKGGVNAHFALKGGVALELRLKGRARATRDLDLSYRGPATNNLVEAVAEALKAPYERFTSSAPGSRWTWPR